MAFTFEDVDFSFSDKGIFGFLRPENLLICFFLYGIMCGFFGFCGYMISTNYFSEIIVMNCLIFESLFSQLVGVYIGVDDWPGVLTWLGILMVGIAINI